MTAPNDATLAQMNAARPDASTWLAANAGSGKTRVLTDRVARLLLDNVDPQNILCLTYTKAAASEMQNRLFKRLGAWAMLADDLLVLALRDLGVDGPITPERLRMARTLFARAIETPGGLKIQTIHSFCASLLRRFPLEAGVSPQFTEIEDRAADLLRAEIVDQMADGPDAGLVEGLAQHYTGEDFSALTRAIVSRRQAFVTPINLADALEIFGQPADLDESAIEASVFVGGEQMLMDTIIPPMLKKGGNDGKHGAALRDMGPMTLRALPVLESIFLYGRDTKTNPPFSAKIGAVPTGPTRAILAEVMPELNAFMSRIEEARDARLALAAAQRTLDLHRFAARFVILYEAAKLLRGWLDFDDLIGKARQLLTDPQVAAWVLFRIDGGIDHILVDEAQDTSPAQWDVIRKLAAEFSSGEGARRNTERTIFVVGDKKQSIYSFQGADPNEFDRMEQEFRIQFDGAQKTFQSERLEYSFRSSPVILELVDHVFGHLAEVGQAETSKHLAFKNEMPGRVDLWPQVETAEKEPKGEWSEPLDLMSNEHHTVVLADRIARQIKILTDGTHMIAEENDGKMVQRPVQAGDFLILVQRRSPLFSEIIRACKAAGLPIAGADRLKVGAELAVRDIAALLSFLAMPDDDLSLASALKSPLFGWSEQALFDLAHKRSEDHLWQALRTQEALHPNTLAILHDLRASTDFLRPYDLIERILTRHSGRRRLLARLGPEAEDGINALLSQALSYEQTAVPSLTGFLIWMQADDLMIKRQIDAASNEIRVMTVHGAKGLEAPIVILPDTARRNVQIRDEIIPVDGVPVWKTSSGDMPRALQTAMDQRKEAERKERLRLLYVALTRAESWLIVAAAGDLPKEGSWYQLVEQAMQMADAKSVEFEGGAGLRMEFGDWSGLPDKVTQSRTSPDVVLEPFLNQRAAPEPDLPETLSPSKLGGPKALPGDDGQDEDAAKTYGTLVHRLLEHLPGEARTNWPDVTAAICADAPFAAQASEEAQAVLDTPELAYIFSRETLAEVTVSARLGSHALQGVIDRLIVDADRVLAVDYKTNRVIPSKPEDTPLGILRQLGAYAHALEQVYPGRRIETAILWTSAPTLMQMPHDIVTDALQTTLYLDDPGPSS